jgi:hypothetical protein
MVSFGNSRIISQMVYLVDDDYDDLEIAQQAILEHSSCFNHG